MKDYEKKYQLLREEKLEDIHSTGYLLQHVKSKAHVLVIANDDENKVFNISFRTRPVRFQELSTEGPLCGTG